MSKVIDQLFEGVEGLSPEFKEKVQVVFEAAVQEAVDSELATKVVALTEATEQKTAEAITEVNKQVLETLDVFLAEAVQEWVTENAVGVDSKLKTEIAESFVEGLATLFATHNVKLDETTIDKVADLEKQLAEATTALTAAQAVITEATVKEASAARTLVLEAKLEGLADTTKDRVKRILETMEFKSEEDFGTKLGYIVEAVAGVTGKKDDAAEGKGKPDDEGKDKVEKSDKDAPADKEDKNPMNEQTEAPNKDLVEAVQSQETVVKLDPVVEATLAYMRKSARKGARK